MLPPISSAEFPTAFAAQWIANWNARDLPAVLSHFRDDCIFESPIAEKITCKARLVGKAELQKYWEAALSQINVLRFTLDDWIWDPSRRALVLVYTSLVDGRVTSCCELMVFDTAGRQHIGKAYYGIVTVTHAAYQMSRAAGWNSLEHSAFPGK